MNKNHKFAAAQEARHMIDCGIDPQSLTHILYYPSDYWEYEEGIMGLANPLPPNTRLDGYINQYFTLTQLVEMGEEAMPHAMVYLIMEDCDDPFYPGHPTGRAFNTRQAAEEWIKAHKAAQSYQVDYYIAPVVLRGTPHFMGDAMKERHLSAFSIHGN